MNRVLLIFLFVFLGIESASPQGIVYSIPQAVLDSIEIQESKNMSSNNCRLFHKRKATIVLSELFIKKDKSGISIAPMYNNIQDTSISYYSSKSDRFIIIHNRPVPVYFDYDSFLGTTATLSDLSTNPYERIYKRLFILSHPEAEYIVPLDYQVQYQERVLCETDSAYKGDIVYMLPIQLEEVLDLMIEQTDCTSKAIYLSISFDQTGSLLLLNDSISYDSFMFISRKVLVGQQLLPVIFDYDCIFGGFCFPLNKQDVLAKLTFQLYPFKINEISLQ